jgi:rsbT co-antagonist protein RsbR
MLESKIDSLIKENDQLKNQLKEYKKMVEDTSVSILLSIIPKTALVSMTKKLETEQLEMIISKMFDSFNNQNITTVIFDFTCITKESNQELSLDLLESYMRKLTNDLSILGIQMIFVGFTPTLMHKMVHAEVTLFKEYPTFIDFYHALEYLNDYKLINKKDVCITS